MKKNKQITISYLIILVCASLWGAIGVCVRYISKFNISTMQNTCFRIFTTTLTLFLIIFISDRHKLKIQMKDLKYYFGSGICGILLNHICYAISVQKNSLSMAAILLYTAPLLVMLLATLFFHEKLTVGKLFALFLCLGGCVLVVGIGVFRFQTLSSIGVLAGLGSALGYALYSIFAKILTKKYDTLTLTLYTFLFAFLGILPMVQPIEIFSKLLEMPERILPAMFSAVLTGAVPYLLFPLAIRYVESSKASIIATFEIAASTIVGMIGYQEKLTWLNGIGILMIVGAIILLNLSEKEK